MELQIKTSCENNSESKEEIVFAFCQNGKCCSTGSIPAQNANCKINYYNNYNRIGDCVDSNFVYDSIKGNVTYSDLESTNNTWKPEWVKLLFNNSDTIIKCYLNERMDNGDPTEPTFLDFECKPEGNLLYS